MQNINHVIQQVKHTDGTFSGKKSFFCIPDAIIVGHKCTYEGRLLDDSQIAKVKNWPVLENISDVHGFLGILGMVCIYIPNYADHVWLLSALLRKDCKFKFNDVHLAAFETLKCMACDCSAISTINYNSRNEVILAVNSSWYAARWWLSQIGDDKKCYPS